MADSRAEPTEPTPLSYFFSAPPATPSPATLVAQTAAKFVARDGETHRVSRHDCERNGGPLKTQICIFATTLSGTIHDPNGVGPRLDVVLALQHGRCAQQRRRMAQGLTCSRGWNRTRALPFVGAESRL
jgi:hypothetical protein